MLKYPIKIIKFVVKSVVFVCFLVIMLFLTAKNIPQTHGYTEKIETKIEERWDISIDHTWDVVCDVLKTIRRTERHGFPSEGN